MECAGRSNPVDPVSMRAAEWADCGLVPYGALGNDHPFRLLRIALARAAGRDYTVPGIGNEGKINFI